jgi:hypothetical protein
MGPVGVNVLEAMTAVFSILHKEIDHIDRFTNNLSKQALLEIHALTNPFALFLRSKVKAAFEVVVEISGIVVCILRLLGSLVHSPTQ